MILGDFDLQKALLSAVTGLLGAIAILFWKLYENMRERYMNAEKDREAMWQKWMETIDKWDNHKKH